MLIFGGSIGNASDSASGNDLWSFATPGGWQLVLPDGAAGSPPARQGHAAAWDSEANRLLLFGGGFFDSSGFATLNDLWEYTTDSSWRILPAQGGTAAPAPRHSHVVVWDSHGHRLIMFGGLNHPNAYNELWQYTDSGWWQRLTLNGAPDAPAPRMAAAGTWDSQANRLLVFGGKPTVFGSYYNDLWQYTALGGWQQLTANGAPSSPPGRVQGTAVWDSHGGRLLLFGGGENPFMNDLWQYKDASGWRLLTRDGAIGAPRPRAGHTAVWDVERRRLLVHAGYKGGDRYADLWRYGESRVSPDLPVH